MTSEQIYREGAYKGVAMGIYLSIASLFMLAGNGTVLSLVALAMLIGVPFFQHRLMLAAYKRPRYYRICDRLPHTATGKLQRSVVREQAVIDFASGLLHR